MNWRDWKNQVSIEAVLQRAGKLETLHREGNRLVGPCPVHHGDNPRAFRVDCLRNFWYCFTRCGTGGDQLSLAWHLCQRSWPETARWLQGIRELPSSNVSASRPPLQPSQAPARHFVAFTRSLPLATAHPFFSHRGLSEDTLERFDAGVWLGRGFLENMAAVRLFDLQGHPLGYAGRRLDVEAARRYGKWKWPAGFPKSSTLYNWHRVWPQAADTLVVVEGAWSVMKLAQAGFPNAVALGGTTVSDCQLACLQRASRLILMLDGDDAGYRAARRYHQQTLHPRLVTLHPPEGKDPADLSEVHLQRLLAPLSPVNTPAREHSTMSHKPLCQGLLAS